MTKKIYRRLLLAGVMLLMAVCLMAASPAQRAAVQETCDECNARCDAIYQSCIDQGYPTNVCLHAYIPCSSDCLYGVCSQ